MDEQLEYVGFWRRAGAMVVDTLILSAMIIIPVILAV